MADSVSGYRSLAQLGVGAGVPAHVQAIAPASAQPSDPTLPPVPLTTPRWNPVDPKLTVPSTTTARALPYPFQPFGPAIGTSAGRDARDGYNVLGLQLPGIRRSIDVVGGSLLQYHPSNPNYRMTGQHQQQATVNAQVPADRQAPPSGGTAKQSDGGERSGLAKSMMLAGIGGGFLANAIDIARTVKKYPEALRAAKFDPSLGTLGRLPTAIGLTAAMRPDARLVDPMAPRVPSAASLGKSFTRFDEIAMKSSVLLGTSLAALQLASAVPNLADALSKDGPWYQNIAQSTSGRAGVLQLAGGGLGLGVFLTALHQTKGVGATGVVDRVMAAAKAPIMARPVFTTIGLASGAVVMANELGYLDFLNTGETRSVPTVLSDAAHRTPVINDPALRTGALLTAGGVLGYKMQRAITAAGGLSGLGKGHLIGGAVIAGLLGAQLLGGLDALDKPEGS